MTEGEKKAKYEHIVATAGDPDVVAHALAALQAKYPDEWGKPEPSHALPLTPEKKAKIARLQAQGQINESDYVGSKSVLDPATVGMDLYRGAKDLQSGATAGFADRLNYLTGADTPEHRAAEMSENPMTSSVVQGVSGAGGSLAPGSPTNIIGRGAAGLVGMAERVVPALATRGAGRAVAQTATGALAGGALGGMQARNMGADVPTSLRAAGHGAMVGGALAGIPATVGEGAQFVRDRSLASSPHLQTLEEGGYTTTPIPFKPTMRRDGGTGPSSPSEALGVPANASSRGQLAREAGDTVQDEVAFLKRGEKTRARNELETSTKAQGGRSLSVEDDIRLIDEELGRPGVGLDDSMRTVLGNARKMLTGEMEPTADIFTVDPHPYNNRPGVANVEVPEADPNFGVHKRVPYDPRPAPERAATLDEGQEGPKMFSGGEAMEQPPTGPEQEVYVPLNKRVQSIGPDVTAHAGGEDPITVGMGDVRGRVGDAPNHVRSAEALNQIRDALDRAMDKAVFQEGATKESLPIWRLANQMRQRVRTEAPAMGLANRRSHTARRKLERTEVRLRGNTDDSESLTSQLGGAGDPDSMTAGGREARLGPPSRLPPARREGKLGPGLRDRGDLNLRAQFPQSELAGSVLDAKLDAPRLLAAEEAQSYKPSFSLRRNIDVLQNRLLYPVARGLSFMGGEPPPPTSVQMQGSSTPGGRPLGAPQYGNAPEGPNPPGNLDIIGDMLPAMPPSPLTEGGRTVGARPTVPLDQQTPMDMLGGPPTGVPGAMVRNRSVLLPELYNVLYDAQGRLLPDIRDRAERERQR